MWPIFGAGNQIVAALALTTVSVWLVQRSRQYLFAILPAAFMVATTVAALLLLIRTNLVGGANIVLGLTSVGLLLLGVGVVVCWPPRPRLGSHGQSFCWHE
jgi:carbon starvation protein